VRKEPTITVRIRRSLADRIAAIAEPLNYSTNRFAEIAIEEMLLLLETPPDQRRMPRLVAMFDAIRELERNQSAWELNQSPPPPRPQPGRR